MYLGNGDIFAIILALFASLSMSAFLFRRCYVLAKENLYFKELFDDSDS
jgi:hypothetical protein